MKILRYVWWPLAVLYDMVTRLRNHLYTSGYKPAISFDTFTLCVGNLNVGGSGKTPMIEYLIRRLKDQRSLAVISRGYGRKTRGFVLATEQEDALTIGDEPSQYFHKFGNEVIVAVGEERALAIPHVLQVAPETDVILLDDAFQHRHVAPHFTVLLTDYRKPFYEDHVLPMGRLREARRNARRADVIIVSKCPPTLASADQERMITNIRKYAGGRPVFFSTVKYELPRSFGKPCQLSDKVMLVTGIAKTDDLEAYVRTQWTLVGHHRFADHHRYSTEELSLVTTRARELGASLLTTEKDMMRLVSGNFGTLIAEFSWFYLPIELDFIAQGPVFDQLVIKAIDQFAHAKD